MVHIVVEEEGHDTVLTVLDGCSTAVEALPPVRLALVDHAAFVNSSYDAVAVDPDVSDR